MHGPHASSRSFGRRLRTGFLGFLLTASIAAGSDAAAQLLPFTPLQVSLTPGAQALPRDVPVWGVSFNIVYGIQQEVKGLDLGFFNQVDEDLQGASLGLVNIASKNVIGLHAGMANAVEDRFTGLQVGMSNQIGGDLWGLQLGVANGAKGGYGVQLGIMNHATSVKGLQFGLLNFNKSGPLPFFPGVNFHF